MDAPFKKNLLAVSILMASMSSFAADYTLSTSVTGTQEVDAPGTVTVASAGGVDCTHCGDSAMVLVGDGFVSFSNAGTLTGGDGGDGLSLALGSMSGDLVNTGTITAITPDLDLTEDGNSAVRLVYLNEPGAVGGFALRGKIINESSGEMSSAGDGYTVEIQTGSSAGGLINKGYITNSGGSAVGIAGELTGTLHNSGDIVARGSAVEVAAGTVKGGIINTGAMVVGDGEAWADAITVQGGSVVDGGILNDTTGLLLRDGSYCNDDPYCLGGGIGVSATAVVSGGITNKGIIETTANGLQNARDAGIVLMSVQHADGTLLGSPTVNGNITNTGSITSDFAAIYIGGSTVNGDIVNEGALEGGRGILISSAAAKVADLHLGMLDPADSAAATVINGSLINSGTVIGTASDGLSLDGNVTITGDVINRGTIVSEAVSRGNDAVGAIWLGDDSKGGVKIGGSIINSGLLEADTYHSNAALRRGVITLNGAHQVEGIINQTGGEIGNVASEDHADAFAIWVDDGASVGFITNSGTIYGDIHFGAKGGVFNAFGGTNDAVHNATRINIRSTGEPGATVSRFYDEQTFVYSGVLGVDAFGTANGLAYGQLEVGRGADLRGASVDVNVTGDRFIGEGDSFTFLKAATGGISGDTLQSDVARATDNSAVLDFSVKQVDNTLVATAKRAAFAAVIQPSGPVSSGGGANTQAVAGALDSVVNALGSGQVDANSELGQVVNALSAIGSGEELAAAIQTLQPETVSGSMNGASAAGNAAAGVVNNRQASLRSHHAYGESGMVAGGEVAENGFWLKGYGSLADQDERSGISGYEADTAGLALGFDVPLSANISAGLAFTYGHTDVTSDNKNTVDIDSYQLSAYGSYNASKYFVDALVSYAENTYDSRRTLFNGLVAKGDHDGQQYDMRARFGYPLAISEALRITPQLTAQYTYLEEDRYTETGAGNAGLTIAPDDNEAFILGASVELAYSLTDSAQNTWIPSLNLGVFEDLIGDEAEFNSSFVGVPVSAFSTRGIEIETTSYVVGLGLRVFGQGNLDVSVNYDYVARSGYESQNLQATVRWAF